MVMSFVLRYFYVYRSASLTGKRHISTVLPILSGIIFIVIVIVKSSLALSLGLVGALSIVRFRTPIKEPEELIYLFLAIEIGLGFGAGYMLETTVLTIILLLIINFWVYNHELSLNEYNMLVAWEDESIVADKIIDSLNSQVDTLKVIRVEVSEHSRTLVLLITPNDKLTISTLIDSLSDVDPKIKVSVYENSTNW